ncbi:MAG: hypothetical protein MR528_06525 [Lachnospiraceae bacterium]|nr:hypothetical protein [Lachnospiraceae bacterium]
MTHIVLNKVRGKLRGKRGASLSEMLLAVLILSLLTLLVASGSGTAAKVYRSMKEVSESGILADSILMALKGEVRYADDLKIVPAEEGTDAVGGQILTYNSAVYGNDTVLFIELSETGSGLGRLTVRYGKDAPETVYLYQSATYTDFYLCPLEGQDLFTLDEQGEVLTVSCGVCDRNGTVRTRLERVNIRLLNGE